ncbi:MAG: RluA family pseudouridine synthase [Oscillospiraceae bacterium]
MQLEFIVPSKCDGWQLRDYLRHCGVSAQLIKNVKYTQDGISVNDIRCNTNTRVTSGERVCFALPIENETSVTPQDIPVEILYENDHCMVLDKPAFMAVHPTLGYKDGTLANAFCGIMQKRDIIAPFRAVNRLDRNTSGAVLCALNTYSASTLSQNVRKEYIALVEGTLPLGNGRINAPIARCDGSLITRKVDKNGKESITDYTVLECANGYSLVRVMPQTGRTHQIRVHFAHIGCPLAGDDLYGGHRDIIQRHALHCAQMCFQISDEIVTVTSPIAQDICEAMKTVGINLCNIAK